MKRALSLVVCNLVLMLNASPALALVAHKDHKPAEHTHKHEGEKHEHKHENAKEEMKETKE